MKLFQAGYALGNITAARASLASAQRALARKHREELTDADARASVSIEAALNLLEKAIHELGSEAAAQQLPSRTAA
jgi:hypothetical protein